MRIRAALPATAGGGVQDVADRAKVDRVMHVLARSPDVRVHYRKIWYEDLPQPNGWRSQRQKIVWDNGRMYEESLPTLRGSVS